MQTAPLLDAPEHAGRPAAPSRDIYALAVTQGTGTFELDAPDLAEMARRRDDVLAKGLPWLVAEQDGRVLGYAYANHFRPRPAYRFCVEDSIYLRPDAQGRGIGRVLLAELMARCEAAGARQMLAVIGDSANLGSIGVHRALGFEPLRDCCSAVGWKFGRWLDVVLMQRAAGRRRQRAAPRAAPREPRRARRRWPPGWRCSAAPSACTASTCTAGATCIGWLYPVPTLLGLAGVQRMRAFGQDDRVAWVLIPLLGLALSAGHADGHRLRPDARRQMGGAPQPGQPLQATGWAPVLGVIAALLLGASVLMGTVAFSGQRFFEWQLEQAADKP